MKARLLVNLSLLALSLGSGMAADLVRDERSFDADWRFHRGDAPGAEAAAFADTTWRTLDTPHDWSIEDLPPAPATGERIDLSRGTWRFRVGDDAAWKARELDDSAWREVTTPANWEDHGQSRDSNVFGWFRRKLVVPAALHGKDVTLALGAIDDVDETFVNGEKIGGTGSPAPNYVTAWTEQRVYTVPARLLRYDGSDVVAVRVFDGEGNGGLNLAAVEARRVGPFDTAASEGRESTGWVVGGVGWYRKHFRLPDARPDRRVEVRFDGVYMDCQVWLNGTQMAEHPYGYTSFTVDLTPQLRRDGDNILAVKVNNIGKNSRWYSGSGIYRHVWLTTTGPLHVPTWGLFVTTPEVTAERATVSAEIELAGPVAAKAEVLLRVLDPAGKEVARTTAPVDVPAGAGTVATVTVPVAKPELWSCEMPRLYRALAEVHVAGRPVDRVETSFGIRRVELDAEHGFRLNGQPLELKGGCVHHDNGPLGSITLARAEERRVERLKAAGYNAIRTSHNPPSPAFLDACDRLGVLVMDEAFDQWLAAKNPNDYHRFFDTWCERDIASMVRRDRNHPSVVFWSIGNEIQERFDRPDLALRLRQAVLRSDGTRPVTAAICGLWDNAGKTWDKNSDPAFLHLDLGGYNYEPGHYESDHQRQPARVMACTESFPKDAFHYWDLVEKLPYVIGDFVWTAYDYLGESGIGRAWVKGSEPGGFVGPFPWHVAGCGDLDLLGGRKPQSYYREALWRPGVLHATVRVPLKAGEEEQVSAWGWPLVESHWTWPGHEGQPLRVEVYSSCEKVRLFLDGRDLGEKPTTRAQQYKAEFVVPYAPGEIKAVGTLGNRTQEFILRTAGAPAALRLTADRTTLHTSRDDLSFVAVEVIDSYGVVVPTAVVPVTVALRGPAELAALANADPAGATGYRGAVRRTWQGALQAIVRPTGKAGTVTLTATAPGLTEAQVAVTVR